MSAEPIAIVGAALRFPGADNLESFWHLLREGREALSQIPESRWSGSDLFDPDPDAAGKYPVARGGFLEEVYGFDWRAFGIPPREARQMDPQHRLLLELAFEALADAGETRINEQEVSVFMGVCWNDYFRALSRDWSKLDGYSLIGNIGSFAANRISYVLGLQGQSTTVDASCASSLVAIHHACASLRSGDSDMALAGGVELMLAPDSTIMMGKAGVLSATDRCKTLSAGADGFVRGEGGGIAVLKPLSKVTSRDRVYALIRGTAVNHNGHNEWIMASSGAGLRKVIKKAHHVGGTDPTGTGYVELHGSGTAKGDPIESKAVSQALGTANGPPVAIGSVKTNIGNLGAAGGIAGLFKVALALYHRELPASLHLDEPNPAIDFEGLGLIPQAKLTPWPERSGRLLAGVTATSLSGSNAHAVLQAAESTRLATFQHHEQPSFPRPLPLSAFSATGLREVASRFRPFLASSMHNLDDICFTASARREALSHRLVLVADSREGYLAALDGFLNEEPGPDVYVGTGKGQVLTVHFEPVKGSVLLDFARELTTRAKLASLLSRFEDDMENAPSPHLFPEKVESQCYTILPGERQEEIAAHLFGALFCLGCELEWDYFFSPSAQNVSLPGYPWQREILRPDWLSPETLGRPPEAASSCGRPGLVPHSPKPAEPGSLHRHLEGLPPRRRRKALITYLGESVAGILELPGEIRQAPEKKFFELGLNSMAGQQLRKQLEVGLEWELPATIVIQYPSFGELADYLLGLTHQGNKAGLSRPPDRTAGASPLPVIPAVITEMAESDAMALLLAKLENLEGGVAL